MASNGRLVLAALGWATLVFLPLLSPIFSRSGTWLYHFSGSAAVLLAVLVSYLCLLWLVLSLCLALSARSARTNRLMWSAVILTLPWVLANDIWMLTDSALPHGFGVSIAVVSLGCFLGFNLLWKPFMEPPFATVRRFASTTLAITGISGLAILAQLAALAWLTRDLNRPPILHQRQAAVSAASAKGAAPAPRILWIVFDELSYNQLYEHRFPGIKLDAFDALAAQSTVFTQVRPEEFYTDDVLPAYITGLPVDQVRPSADSRQISLHDSEKDTWRPMDPHATVFQDALNAGLNTGVAGWYNPYCRIFSAVLDRCAWSFNDVERLDLSSSASYAANMLAPWRRLVYAVSDRMKPAALRRVESARTQAHIEDYRRLIAAADDLLADPSANFVLLHLPIPHPYGIFDRHSMTLLAPGSDYPSSYIDNLALTDECLAHIRQVLERQGQWDSTTVVVMGDHSWRNRGIWMGTTGWTEEDAEASRTGGAGNETYFDDRPAYIVKLPGQTAGARYDQPFEAVRTRELLDALIAGQIHTAEELREWAAKR